MRVTIEYCEPCGQRDTALLTQRHLLDTFGCDLTEVALRTCEDGAFRVLAEHRLIFDQAGCEHYDLDAIVAQVDELLHLEGASALHR